MMMENVGNLDIFEMLNIVYGLNDSISGVVKDQLILQPSVKSCHPDALWDWNSAKEPVMLLDEKMDNVFMER